jgi:hypothetical protein
MQIFLLGIGQFGTSTLFIRSLMRSHLITLIVFVLVTPFARSQQMENENLLQTIPSGYKIGFQTKQGNMLMSEFVPERESVDNWTEMVTTQVFLGLKRPTPNEFRQLMQQTWAASCKDSGFADVAAGDENGYPFEVWIQDCPNNQRTGKPERFWFKAIKGNDSFYLVQKAFRFSPEPDQVVRWTHYLRSIHVCDSRLSDRACSKAR